MKQRMFVHIAVSALAATLLLGLDTPAHADVTVCDKFGSTTIQSGRYVVQNNDWGDNTTQCINVTATGFSVTTASHNQPTNGAPGAYPSVYFGCHYANCSVASGLPLQASTSTFSQITSAVSMSYPGSGVYDAAYDVWFDPTPRTDGQNTGAEVMIWLNHTGSIQPFGSQVGTASINGTTWNVWEGNAGWNVVSYVRQATTSSLNFRLNDFYTDAINRGYAQRAWYLTSIQAGFEPWIGGVGLTVNSFSVSTSGGGGDTTPPSTPGTPNVSGVTSSSVHLSWGASTDNVGVTGYDVVRVSGSAETVVASPSANSATISGLSPSTAYTFAVYARDAAGNRSARSGTVNATTSGSSGGGGCSATWSAPSVWSNGYVGNVNVTNTGSSAISAWTVTATFPNGHTITNSWNATLTVNGGTLTAHNASFNGNLGAGATASWGFQASRPNGDNALPTNFTCAVG